MSVELRFIAHIEFLVSTQEIKLILSPLERLIETFQLVIRVKHEFILGSQLH